MDAKKVGAVLDAWVAGKTDFAETSFALIALGCSAAEVKSLIEQFPRNETKK
jgi:hypothetical protein